MSVSQYELTQCDQDYFEASLEAADAEDLFVAAKLEAAAPERLAELRAQMKACNEKWLECFNAMNAEADDAEDAAAEDPTEPVVDPVAPKPKSNSKFAIGLRAWSAFEKHCKQKMPERFTDTESDLHYVNCRVIRAEDPAAYEAFIADFKLAEGMVIS